VPFTQPRRPLSCSLKTTRSSLLAALFDVGDATQFSHRGCQASEAWGACMSYLEYACACVFSEKPETLQRNHSHQSCPRNSCRCQSLIALARTFSELNYRVYFTLARTYAWLFKVFKEVVTSFYQHTTTHTSTRTWGYIRRLRSNGAVAS
jgi:hypothetical protein